MPAEGIVDTDRPPGVIVVAGGAPVTRGLTTAGATVIAADSGVALARAMGLEIDVAVGDFDSLDPDLVARLDDLAGEVRRFATDKDATDLELALQVAGERAPAQVLVLGLEGGRPDHALANLLLAASTRFAALDIELVLDRGRAWIVRDTLHGDWLAGALLSVLPLHGDATVSISGVRWPLDHARLAAGTTHGVSNEAVGGPVTLTVHDGTAICIAPHNPTEESP
ncbi:MAG: thiamine diphosphokinase [Acidimicrobiales bacterium]|nr:thiamine diphosphokinase [Acidimicrobiales bacterium]